MKKMMVVAVMALLVLPAAAWSANVAPGKYTTSITSVLPELNGKTFPAEAKLQGTDNFVKVSMPDGTWEEWTWNNKTLIQKEYDKAGKVVQQYTATNVGGKYMINCKDKAKNDCDAGIDSRNYWTINVSPNTITYVVYGVSKEMKGNPTAKTELRHTFAFKAATTTPTTTTAPATTTAPKTK